MTEWTKTLLFAAAACVLVGLAVASQSLARPAASMEFERVGEEFYPDFTSPLEAQALEVVTYDDATSVIKSFNVKWGENGWTISPYGYPADAKDQLEKTAASVVGIKRTGLASRRESEQAQYDVIDPLSEDATKLKGRGKRITLKNEKGDVLADYILGKPVEGREGYFYVRKPKEKETYIAKVDLNLSTRFADWIESDLLKLNASDLKKVEVQDYSLDEDRGVITSRNTSVLVRGEDAGPWKLEGLDEATEQVNTSAVNSMTRVLDELKIIGVRPKPKGLNADLSLAKNIIENPLAQQVLGQSLRDKGFYLAQDREGGALKIFSKEGQLIAATNQGIVYDLYFGEQFTGSQFELEFGDTENADEPKQLKKGEKKESEQGRYVFIAAHFDPSSLGEEPAAPAAAEPPAADASDEAKKAAEAAAKKANDDYAAAKKAYDAKVTESKKQVEELNDRFSDWYYVISTENFEDLRPSREKLVQPKTAETNPATNPTTNPLTNPLAPSADPAQPPAETAGPRQPLEAPRPEAEGSEVKS